MNAQIDSLNAILKKYDPTGMLIGEAPCMKDMIETTDHDFKVVNAVSILAIFLIILLVGAASRCRSCSSPLSSWPFSSTSACRISSASRCRSSPPICISTIQLGATVDYAILMTTR